MLKKHQVFGYMVFIIVGCWSWIKGEDVQDKYGQAFLSSVRNETIYEMKFFYYSSKIIDSLKDGMQIQLRAHFEGSGRYYRAVKDGNNWKLRCDSKDSKDKATIFTVKKYANSLQLLSEVAGKKILKANEKTYEVEFVDPKTSDDAAYWTLVGDTLDNCYLRNIKLEALLSPRSDENRIRRLDNQIEVYEQKPLEIIWAEFGREGFGWMDVKDKLVEKIKEIYPKYPYVKKIELNPGNVGVEDEWIVGSSEGKGPIRSWMRKLFGAFWLGTQKHLKFKVKMYDIVLDRDEWQVGSNDGIVIEADPRVNPNLYAKIQKRDELKKAALKGVVSADKSLGSVGYPPQDLYKDPTIFEQLTIEPLTTLEEEERGGGEVIKPGATQAVGNIAAIRNPEMRGNCVQVIPGFGPEMLIVLQALYGGWAWLEESLSKPWKATILFRVIAEDSGNVRIALSDKAGVISRYVIVLGASNNTEACIYKDGNMDPVYRVKVDENPLARVSPGILENIWISLNDGLIVVGKGDPGTGIIMAWRDQDKVPMINRIGFGSAEKPVRYTEIEKVDDPLVIIKPSEPYVSVTKGISMGVFPKPLSPADAGAVEFAFQGDNLTVSLVNAKNKGYDLSFGTNVVLRRHEGGKELKTINLAQAAKMSGRYWVSLYKGSIIAGKGSIGTNPFLIWLDGSLKPEKMQRGITKIVFSGKATIQNVSLWPQVEMGFGEKQPSYIKTQGLSDLKGSLIVDAKYNYRITQRGPQVFFKDLLSGGEWAIGKAPKPDGTYIFSVTIQQDGKPKLDLQQLIDSVKEIELRKNVYIAQKAADASFQSASALSSAGGAGGPISQTITGVAAVLAAGGGVLAKSLAAKDEASLNEIQKLADRYIYTEDVSRPTTYALIPPEAQKNSDRVDVLLTEFDKAKYTDITHAIDVMREVVQNVNHVYIVKEAARRDKIYSNISEIYKTFDKKSLETSVVVSGKTVNILDDKALDLYNKMLDLLVAAYDNPYLIDTTIEKEASRKDDLYVWANDLAKKIFNNKQMVVQGIEVGFREMMWPYKLDPVKYKDGVCVYFEAKAGADVFVGFAKSPFKVRANGSPMYEVGFGRWNNSQITIARRSLGDAVIKFDQKKHPDFELRPDMYIPLWVNIYKGKITLGTGTPDLTKKGNVSWQDPYPSISISDIGFSKWYKTVMIRKVKITPPLQLKEPKSKGSQGNVVFIATPTVSDVQQVPSQVKASSGVTTKKIKKADVASKSVEPVAEVMVPAQVPVVTY